MLVLDLHGFCADERLNLYALHISGLMEMVFVFFWASALLHEAGFIGVLDVSGGDGAMGATGAARRESARRHGGRADHLR